MPLDFVSPLYPYEEKSDCRYMVRVTIYLKSYALEYPGDWYW
jgi:hypothetical protein